MRHAELSWSISYRFFFFFNDTATTEIYTLSLHDALPISRTSNDPGLPLSVGTVVFVNWTSATLQAEARTKPAANSSADHNLRPTSRRVNALIGPTTPGGTFRRTCVAPKTRNPASVGRFWHQKCGIRGPNPTAQDYSR